MPEAIENAEEISNKNYMDELPDIPSINEFEHEFDDHSNMKFVLTNARSIMPKLYSLIDYFTELELSFAMITETWLKKESLERIKGELQHECSLSIKPKTDR